jgi:hypothetical protein
VLAREAAGSNFHGVMASRCWAPAHLEDSITNQASNDACHAKRQVRFVVCLDFLPDRVYHGEHHGDGLPDEIAKFGVKKRDGDLFKLIPMIAGIDPAGGAMRREI